MPSTLLALALLACGSPPSAPPLVVTQAGTTAPRVARVHLPEGAAVPLADDGTPRGAIALCTDGRVLAQEQDGERVRLVVIGPAGVERTPLAGLRLRAARCTADGAVIAEAAVDGAGDLYRVQGGAVTRLTEAEGGSFEPDLSPSGDLLFASSRDGNAELYLQRAAGGAPVRLTSHPHDDLRPLWSPTGDRVLFLTGREGSLRAWVMGADGNGARPVLQEATGEHLDAQWTPDGSVVLVVDDPQGHDVLVVDPRARTVLRRIGGPEIDEEPRVSPDGRWLARTRAGDTRVDVVLLDLRTGTEVVIPEAWGARWAR